jgi:hypothetical protein
MFKNNNVMFITFKIKIFIIIVQEIKVTCMFYLVTPHIVKIV